MIPFFLFRPEFFVFRLRSYFFQHRKSFRMFALFKKPLDGKSASESGEAFMNAHGAREEEGVTKYSHTSRQAPQNCLVYTGIERMR